MRERQQMASRPFASVAVALDAKGEQTDLMQPMADVRSARFITHIHTRTQLCIKWQYNVCSKGSCSITTCALESKNKNEFLSST